MYVKKKVTNTDTNSALGEKKLAWFILPGRLRKATLTRLHLSLVHKDGQEFTEGGQKENSRQHKALRPVWESENVE